MPALKCMQPESGDRRAERAEEHVTGSNERKTNTSRGRRASQSGGRAGDSERLFVVQVHDASTRHFDFRLEIGGMLRSWSVPKGPSTDPRERRLAVLTEDCPVALGGFEGVIPEGKRGGGRVLVWDRGTYRSLRKTGAGRPMSVERGFEDGKIAVYLHGEKLIGGFELIRTGDRGGRRQPWLLIKMDDEGADPRRNPVLTEPGSVLSGRTIDEIGEDGS